VALTTSHSPISPPPQLQNLREALNDATRRQIEAEDLLRQEGDSSPDDTMTDAEMEYLSAMEEVKTISRKLVCAEQAFTLVQALVCDLEQG